MVHALGFAECDGRRAEAVGKQTEGMFDKVVEVYWKGD